MTMTLIETKTLGTAAALIDFTAIPQDGTDLFLLMSTRSTRNVGGFSDVFVTFNNSTSGYSFTKLVGDGSSPSIGAVSNTSNIYPFDTAQATNTANTFANSSIYIPNYTAAVNKSVSFDHVTENNATNSLQTITAAIWANTEAISSIKFAIISGFSYDIGTSISLYKITKGSSGGVVVS